MKNPKEIKKGLTWCIKSTDCKGCPYEDDCYVNLRNTPMVKEAHDYIQQLEADNSRLSDTIRNMTELLNAAHEETAKARRERDAAVEDAAMGGTLRDVLVR